MADQDDAHQEHERRLAAALRELVHQIDINDYRDSKGHTAKTNLAFIKAQAVSDEFCVSHDDICQALDKCDGDDLSEAMRWLSARSRGAAGALAEKQPPSGQYQPWTAGP